MLTKASDSGWVIVDQDAGGLPRFWASVWQLFDGTSLAASTRRHRLAAIDRLYQVAETTEGLGNVDELIADLDLDGLVATLESLYAVYQNETPNAVTHADRWLAAFSFVRTSLERMSVSSSNLAPLSELSMRLARIQHLHLGLQTGRRTTVRFVRSLPASVLQEVYQLVTPGSSKNPFPQPATQSRAYTVFCLLLHQGLRVGEALSLHASTLNGERDAAGHWVSWLNVVTELDAPDDPRHSVPSLKNAQSIRQIPVSPAMAAQYEGYLSNWRGRQAHPWLLSSKNRRPLSVEGVQDYFRRLSGALSPEARLSLFQHTRKTTISPHDLRHTCAVVRMKQLLARGLEATVAAEHLRSYFGWSPDSNMPRLYAKAAYDERLMTIWNDAFDDRVAILRSLPE